MVPEMFQDLFHHHGGFGKQMPAGVFFPTFDSPEKILRRLFAKARQLSNATIATGRLQIGDALYLQCLPQNLDLFRAEPLKLKELRQGVWEAAAKFIVIAKFTGSSEFFDLLGDRGTDSFQFLESFPR